jgi:formate C-acetyltransferase
MFDSTGTLKEKSPVTARTINLKKNIENMIDAGVRKTTFYPLIGTSLRQTEGEPKQIRRAKAFEYLLDNVKLEVHPHELLGGSISGMWPVDPHKPSYEEQYAEAVAAIESKINPESGGRAVKIRGLVGMTREPPKGMPTRFALMARDHFDANIDFSRLQKIIREMQDKYAGSGKLGLGDVSGLMEHLFTYDYGEDADLYWSFNWYSANHINLNYGRVINEGWGAILSGIEKCLAECTDPAGREFYTAAQIAVKAAIRYIKRYAAVYLDAAKTETNAARAKELEETGKRLEKAATDKASSFKEAMQLMWITHIIANTQFGCALSFARFDQYMFPFYDADIKNGRITDEEVQDYLCCMFLKVNEPKMRTVQSMVLGGTTVDGKDACNELTRQILRASRVVKLPYPNIALRIAKDLTPDWAYDEAIETIKCGFGMPMLINDDVWIKNFVTLGLKPEDARDYYNMGCVEMLIQNRHAGWYYPPRKQLNSLPGMLGEVLDTHRRGECRFETFDDLLKAVKEKITAEIRYSRVRPDDVFAQTDGYDPFGSVLIDGCLERGRDMCRGGAELPPHIAIGGQGFGTMVDSLATIKTVVFDQKKFSLDTLLDMADKTFKGEEGVRQYILNFVPHFGNDIEWVDAMAADLFNVYTTEVFRLNDGSTPMKYVSSFFSYTVHVSMGEITPATPDGRLNGMPLSDNLGPSQGRDTEGPTRLVNSMLKLDYRYLNGANATNLKVSPNLFITQSGMKALKDLLLTYMHSGGPQIQVNFVRREDLLEAQVDPMKHRDIVVRIAGFCEYFINLDLKQQEEIIARTEHSA